MPRHPRVFVTGQPHHIVQRGHDRKQVFVTDDDYLCYLNNFIEQVEALSIGVYAWCLMTNHVHLLVQPQAEGETLSQLMGILAARHTRYLNRLQGRTGTRWEGRFRCSLVDRIEYLWACCRYVELNPQRAGMVSDPANYRWSSFRSRFERRDAHTPAPPLLPLADNPTGYIEYARGDAEAEEDALLRTAVRRNQVTGGRRFRHQVEASLGRRLSHLAPGRPYSRD